MIKIGDNAALETAESYFRQQSKPSHMNQARLQAMPPHLVLQKGEIRLFKNNLLERLNRISPITVLAVYLPMIMFSVTYTEKYLPQETVEAPHGPSLPGYQ